MGYPKKCKECGYESSYKHVMNGKEICHSCLAEFPKPEKKAVVGMMDSAGIVRVG